MDVAYFVGVPDWRSAMIALAITFLWLFWLGRGWLRSPGFWLAIVVAAALFAFSIAWVQVPIQQTLGVFWTHTLDVPTIQRYLLLLGLPSLLVASLVQEVAKLVVAIGALWILGKRRGPRAGLAIGAAAGAGFGGFEAFWVFNQMFGMGWSWAMVDLNGPVALVGFVERFFTVPFHIGSAALSGYGYATGRPWRFLGLAVLLHTALNYAALLVQAKLLSVLSVEPWVAVVGVATYGAALWLRKRSREGSLEHPTSGDATSL